MNKSRNLVLDIMKGIGILLVVIGHNFDNNSKIFIYIYSFHMPLFFLLSGYFFKYEHNFKKFINKKTYSIIMPYLYFSLISIILYNMFISSNLYALSTFFFSNRLGMGNIPYNTPLWFLSCLFLISMFYYLIYIIKNKCPKLLGIKKHG